MYLPEFKTSFVSSTFSVQCLIVFKKNCFRYTTWSSKISVRDSPLVDSLLWIIDAPVLSKDTIDKYIQFVDSIIKTCVPDVSKDTGFYNLLLPIK